MSTVFPFSGIQMAQVNYGLQNVVHTLLAMLGRLYQIKVPGLEKWRPNGVVLTGSQSSKKEGRVEVETHVQSLLTKLANCVLSHKVG